MSAAINKTIERLKAIKDSSSPILSIYLYLDKYSNPELINILQDRISANLSLDQRKEMQKNIQQVVGFIKQYQRAPKDETLALFTRNDMYEVLRLPYKVEDNITYAHEPYLVPLLKEQSKRYLIILSDKQKALLYTVFLGVLEHREAVFDDSVPQKVSSMGADGLRTQKNDKQQKHVHEHLKKHFDYIAKRASDFVIDKPIAGVILGGHKTEMSQFKEHLPHALKDKVVGVFVSELQTNFNEIFGKSQKVIEQANKQFNQQLSPAQI